MSSLCSGEGLWVINSVDPCVLKSNYSLLHTIRSIELVIYKDLQFFNYNNIV